MPIAGHMSPLHGKSASLAASRAHTTGISHIQSYSYHNGRCPAGYRDSLSVLYTARGALYLPSPTAASREFSPCPIRLLLWRTEAAACIQLTEVHGSLRKFLCVHLPILNNPFWWFIQGKKSIGVCACYIHKHNLRFYDLYSFQNNKPISNIFAYMLFQPTVLPKCCHVFA